MKPLTLQRELNRFLGGRRPKAPDLYAKERRQFKTLAAKLGFTFAKTRDGYIEMSPCPTFPKGLVTLHYDWAETLERVEACAADPSLIDADGYYSE